MKIEYTQAQLAALSQMYREQEQAYRRLYDEAEAYLSEGNYVRRESVLADAGNKWWVMEGIKAAAEAIGIPVEVRRNGEQDRYTAVDIAGRTFYLSGGGEEA